MIYIITGEDIVSSRNKLNELLASDKNVVRLDGKKVNITDLELSLESNSLFAEDKSVVLEYFSKLKPPEKLIELALKFEVDKNIKIILWDEADLSAKIKAALKSAKLYSFQFPKLYFAFLDGILPNDKGKGLELFRDVLRSYSAEQILYSIVKRLRQLLVLKSSGYMEFSEFRGMQSWQIGKLKSQSDKWSVEALTKKFLSFAELDEKIKTGALTMDLSNHLDILLASDLN